MGNTAVQGWEPGCQHSQTHSNYVVDVDEYLNIRFGNFHRGMFDDTLVVIVAFTVESTCSTVGFFQTLVFATEL